LTPIQEELCLAAAHRLDTDYAGVDLLPATDGQLYLLEVNSVPGWQGLQSVTETNIAEEFVAYLETALKP
ncbi:MAG TPA: alpha-L-glutamate ligase, partial [Anaerolineae bacterium]|nr:alpha-L-glutamate ligase [Anaerolineae bacterium]